MKFDKALSQQTPYFLHGADYNPEQWDSATIKQDIELAKKAHCNVMTVGVFAWSALQPKDGVLCFDWLDNIMDLLNSNGIRVILATPTAAIPAWMSKKYPEILRQGPDNETGRHGFRVNFCPSSEVYREKCRFISSELAQRYAEHPALHMWHISNEYYKECHCEKCQQKFRIWLQRKYGTLDNLNQNWWTKFWSHSYSAWDEIQSAFEWPRIEWSVLGQRLDWMRFCVDQQVECCANEIKAVKKFTPDIPVTTNAHMTFTGTTDWTRFAPYIDVMSCDPYPRYRARDDYDIPAALENAFCLDYYRSCKEGKPFLRMEGSPAEGSGNRQKRPGILALTAIQSIAHGSDSVQYFQWRNGRGGVEKFHGAIVEHDGSGETRMFRENAQVGKMLEQISQIKGSYTPAKTAIIFDKENSWALELATKARGKSKGYLATCLQHYRALWQQGIPSDVIGMQASLDKYDLIIAPYLYMLREDISDRLETFVSKGGTLITGCFSGYVNENDLVFTGGFPGPLRKLLGVYSQELDGLDDKEYNSVKVDYPESPLFQKRYSCYGFCDVLEAEGAEVLATFNEDYYADRPALCCNSYGKGKAYYIATLMEEEFYTDFYQSLRKDLDLTCALDGVLLPEGVGATFRTNGHDKFSFVMNFSESKHIIETGNLSLVDYIKKLPVDKLELEPHSACVLKHTQ